MAITDKKISTTYAGKDISSLSDKPNQDGITGSQLKARFDQLPKEIIPKYNALIDELNDTVLPSKADQSTTYTKTESDNLLSNKYDKSETYSKTESDGLLDLKMGIDDVIVVKEVTAETLAEGSQATASVTKASDGLTFGFGVPKGDKGDTPKKADIGLDNVDNTSDANKPVSTAQATINTSLSNSVDQVGTRFVKALKTNLKSALTPLSILIMGDSTSSATNKWFYTAMQQLAAKYPKYTFLHSLWDDTLQCYQTPTVMQTGSDGAGHVVITNSYIYASDTASLRITGDIDIRMKISLDDWSPASECLLASKFGSSGTRGWALGVNASKQLYWWWSADGTNLLGGDVASARSSVGMTVNDGDAIWIRATMDVDNGASGKTMKFYTSADGVAWTQLGTDIVSAGTTSIYATTGTMFINGRGASEYSGKVYYLELRKGIDGEIVTSPNFAMSVSININASMVNAFLDNQGIKWIITTGVSLRVGSPAVMLLNGSTASKRLDYSTDVTRFAKQTPIDPSLVFISYSHNEGGAMDYLTAYPAFINQILTKWANAGIVCCTQNPKKTPTAVSDILAHQARCNLIARITATKDCGLVDAYTAFLDTGAPEDYVTSDGVHPTQAGYDLWRDEALKYLSIALK